MGEREGGGEKYLAFQPHIFSVKRGKGYHMPLLYIHHWSLLFYNMVTDKCDKNWTCFAKKSSLTGVLSEFKCVEPNTHISLLISALEISVTLLVKVS